MLQQYIHALVDPSIIVLIIPREWHPLGVVARMGSAPSFLLIALRTANRHFWCCCWELTIPSDCAKKCQQLLKKQNFSHTKRFDTRFLMKTGLKQDLNQAFTAVRWEDFADVMEPGTQLLTMEFLISLAIEETSTKTKIYFRLFNEQFVMKLK